MSLIKKQLSPDDINVDSLISEVKTNKLKTLNLGNCGITDLMDFPEIFELTWLEELIIGNSYFDYEKKDIFRYRDGIDNQIKFIPKALSNLINLKKLILGNELILHNMNNIEVQGLSILSKLKNLTYLDLTRTSAKDYSFIAELKNLTYLDLSHNRLETSDFLEHLPKLEHLYSYGCEIKNYKTLIQKLTSLTHTDLQPTNLLNNNLWEDRKIYISDLKQLQVVYLMETTRITNFSFINLPSLKKIVSIAPPNGLDLKVGIYLSDLPNLVSLDLQNIKIENTIDLGLENLPNLVSLNLQNSQIKDISSLKLEILSNLEHLNLSRNSISFIPSTFLENLPNLKYLALRGNPIENIPIEIVGEVSGIPQGEEYHNCLPALKDYFQSIANKDFQKELNEAKLIIVGVGEVGKSELVEALSEPDYTFVEGRETTLGIRIKNWTLKDCQKQEKSIDFQVNIWDFAGQEINYGTHQFFLTKNSVYVFVWETRKGEEESKFAYWLSVVSLLSENAPVFVVQNKTDIYTSEINQADWKSKFPNIVEFYKTSCKSGSGIEKLRTDIQKELLALPHTFEIWNKDRYAIRESLEQSTENYISHKAYLKICAEKNLTTEQAGFLSKQLHDIGVILHYPNDFDLKKTVVLKPEWATQAAYCLLLDENHVKQGKFSTKDLENIWAEEKFDEKHTFLLGLMKKFELVFQFQESEIYILPERLPIEQPPHPNPSPAGRDFSLIPLSFGEGQGVGQKHLRFEYHYDFMPKGLMSRFICRMHELIKGELFWKYGVVLQYQSAEAIIISSEVEKQIRIEVYGNEADKLLAMIRRDFESIHEKLKNPKLTEKVPCVCEFCKTQSKPHFFDYSLLLEYQNENLPEIRCGIKVKNQVPISALLEGILDTKKVNRELLLELIDEGNIPKFYQELDRLSVSTNEISRLQKEFVHNGANFEYAYKLKVWVRSYFREGRA